MQSPVADTSVSDAADISGGGFVGENVGNGLAAAPFNCVLCSYHALIQA
jgi:hypothetical protein